jgi:hypothetical protein
MLLVASIVASLLAAAKEVNRTRATMARGSGAVIMR